MDASRTNALLCVPRCVMLEYGLLQRAGELLQANDEFWEATQKANKDANKNERSEKMEKIIFVLK